jgi:hypothetical protein
MQSRLIALPTSEERHHPVARSLVDRSAACGVSPPLDPG